MTRPHAQEDDEHEQQQRSVDTQNAQSHLLARQYAEDELLRAKDALERKTAELAQSLASLRATLESTADGILVIDNAGRVTEFNENLARMWSVPREMLTTGDYQQVLGHISQQFRDPDQFVRATNDIVANSQPETYDRLELADRRIVERFSRIQFIGERDSGRVWSFRDITERRRDLERLHQSESQLRMIMDHAPVYISRCDREGKFRFVNRAYAERFGLQPEQVVGSHISTVLGQEAFIALEKYIELVLAGESVEFEIEISYQGLGRRHMHCAYEPERSETGEVAGWIAVVTDITERKLADEAKALLGTIVESSQDAIISKTLEGRILSWNGGAEQLFGYTRSEAIGRPITMFIPPDRLEEERFLLERLSRGERIEHYETVRVTKTGRLIEVSLSISPLRDNSGRIVGASKIARDITARKRVEQTSRFLADASAALAELTDYESTLQRLAGLAVPFFSDWCAVDMRDGEGAVRRLAVTHTHPEKVRWVQELEAKYPSSPSDPSGVQRVLQSGLPDWVAEISEQQLADVAKDHEHLRLIRRLNLKSYICVPLKSRGKVLGALTFATSESGRVYSMDDLRAAEDLAHRAVIAVENANLLAALKETDQRKDEFLAMLAHELRNPLAPIRNAMEILRSKSPPVPELQWSTEVIERQVKQMTRLVDDLLDVSRITRGKFDLRKERIDLATVIDSALEASRPLIDRRRHELKVVIPAERIELDADLTRLSQVFLNLLNNAAKFTDEGGLIELTVERQDDWVQIRVIDSGIGIPARMISRVFDMFAQVDSSLERSQGGLGIGLSLVQRLVEMHGGTVEARSGGPGTGSEFVVRLPIARLDSTQEAEVPKTRGETETQTFRILVVDDNRDAAESLGLLLRMLGHEILTAHDGLQAVEAVATFHPQVVLLDIGLPKLNGFEAAQQIRQRHPDSNIVLIALTGWGQEEDRRQSKAAGFDHHMTKPVDFSALLELLADSRLTMNKSSK